MLILGCHFLIFCAQPDVTAGNQGLPEFTLRGLLRGSLHLGRGVRRAAMARQHATARGPDLAAFLQLAFGASMQRHATGSERT